MTIASDDNDDGSVNITFLSLWEITEILECLLAFHAFYKRGAPYEWKDPVTQESRFRLMGRQMMDMIVRGCPRTDGYGWKIQKLHELLHMASDIAMFGCPQNYDAGPGESSLKTWAKFPARTALKQGGSCIFRICGSSSSRNCVFLLNGTHRMQLHRLCKSIVATPARNRERR
jgi:hypothetical protein